MIPGFAHWIRAAASVCLGAVCLFDFTSCTTLAHHQFSEPAAGWRTKTGQLLYATPGRTLIGDVIVRFAKTGDFQLIVSKGPGITLLSLRQDAGFAEVKGFFAGRGWTGPVQQAPPPLRGWLELRDQFLSAPERKVVRYKTGDETFLFRF